MDRRTFLSATAVAAAAPLTRLGAAGQAPSPAPKPSRLDRLANAATAHRLAVPFDGARFSGPGYDWLLQQASAAQAFLLGEEHGIAENPKLAAQLFADLVRHGYRHFAIETSPPMAAELERAAGDGGIAAIKRLVTAPESRVAFFGLREEAELLAAVHAAAPRQSDLLWGMDYEVAADRFLIRRLKAAPKPAAATRALAALEAASNASWARYDETHNPQYIFSFAGDPKLVRDVQRAWPQASPGDRLILDTLEATLAINRLWTQDKGYESNQLRSQFIRSNFMRHWRAKPRADRQSRVFMKMGASHMVRGLNMSDVFDVGTLVPEILAANGGTAFHLMVLPGPGAQTANLDPTKFLYVPGNRDQYGEGMEIFDKAALPNAFTLFDTAPLRPIASSYAGDVPLPLWRVIHGFDAILIMTGSHPSSNI